MKWLGEEAKILIPIDSVHFSEEAIAIAREFADGGGKLIALHVVSSPHPSEPQAVWDRSYDEHTREKALAFLAKELKDLGHEDIELCSAIGPVAKTIIRFVEENQIDLVVIPSHVRKGISRLFVPSVTDKIIRQLDCPVFVLHLCEDAA